MNLWDACHCSAKLSFQFQGLESMDFEGGLLKP